MYRTLFFSYYKSFEKKVLQVTYPRNTGEELAVLLAEACEKQDHQGYELLLTQTIDNPNEMGKPETEGFIAVFKRKSF